jgi:putative ABC transport system substrate-binding protein
MPAAKNDPQYQTYIASFREGFQTFGWTEGRNVRLEERWGSDAEELRRYAAELAAVTPDVIFTGFASALRPMQQATRSIPIVFANVPDPVANGFVASFARPGGNITGFANYEEAVAAKRLELLKQIASDVARVAVIYDPANPATAGYLRVIETAASLFGVQSLGAPVRNAEEIERTINGFARQPAGGLIVPGGPAIGLHRALIVDLALRHRLPSVHPIRVDALAGGLASYGVDTNDLFRSAASYVDRILKGEKAAELPVQFATKFQLVINLLPRHSALIRRSRFLLAPTR